MGERSVSVQEIESSEPYTVVSKLNYFSLDKFCISQVCACWCMCVRACVCVCVCAWRTRLCFCVSVYLIKLIHTQCLPSVTEPKD